MTFYDHEADATWLDKKGQEWRDCPDCGGEGFHASRCTCMEDYCACLEPDPPECKLCKGNGALPVKVASHG